MAPRGRTATEAPFGPGALPLQPRDDSRGLTMGDVHPQPVDDAQVPADAALPRPLLRDPPPPPGYTNPLEESDLLEELFSAEKGP